MEQVIVLTAMHGRHKTVKYCFDKMPNIHKVVVYSTKKDGEFLDQFENVTKYRYSNKPLSAKWNSGVKKLQRHDFKNVILLGSDDYVDDKFIEYASNIKHDFVGFKDLYFEHFGDLYYWGGYQNHRKGEAAGAGKIYSKAFLRKIHFKLFPISKDRSLDGYSWQTVKEATDSILITTLKENDLFCCDVKDGLGMTDFNNIPNTELCR